MSPEERFTKIENAIESLIGTQAEHAAQIDKQNAGIRDLIVVSRTVLTSIQQLQTAQSKMIEVQDKMIEECRELHKNMIEEVRELHKHTDEKLNILIDSVDRIIRNRNGGGDKAQTD
jgi:hypothetical protein